MARERRIFTFGENDNLLVNVSGMEDEDSSAEGTSYVHLGGVTGLQIGNCNAMSISSYCDRSSSNSRRRKNYPKTPPPRSSSKVIRGASRGYCAAAASPAGAATIATIVCDEEEKNEKRKTIIDKKQERPISEPREDDFDMDDMNDIVSSLGDVKIGGRPVRDDLDISIKSVRLGQYSARYALMNGAVNCIRCYCHGSPSRSRFCPFNEDMFLSGTWGDKADRVRRAALDVNRSGPVPLFNAVMAEARKLIELDPEMDLELGAHYVKTAYRCGFEPLSTMFKTNDKLRPLVRNFFDKHGSDVDAMAHRIVEKVGEAMGRGLYSTVIMMDRCANVYNGKEETPIMTFARVAASLAVEMFDSSSKYYRVMSSRPSSIARVFDIILSALCSYAIVPSSRVLAYAGLIGSNPLFDGVSFKPSVSSVEATFNGNIADVCDMITNGVSVSINLSDFGGDCADILHQLGIHCKSLRHTARFPISVRVIVDIWSMDAVEAFSFILGDGKGYEELTYAFCIPNIFWKRYSDDSGEQWHMFFRDDCGALSKANIQLFDCVYERMEKECAGIQVSPWWVVSSLDACIVQGKTAVIYPHNLNNIVLGGNKTVICGPQMTGVTDDVLGVSAVHNIAINLENCVADGDCDHKPEDIFQGNGCYFNFLALRALIRDAVVIANAILDVSIRDNIYSAGDWLCMYRPLHLSVIGMHNVLNRLGLTYSDENSFVFNRQVFEFIYYSAVRASIDLCMAGSEPFPKYEKSRYLAGRFYFDFFDPECRGPSVLPEGTWEKVRDDVMRYGIRNSAFITGASSEESANLAGTSHGVWPRNYNMTLEKTPFLCIQSREKRLKEAVDVATALKLDVTIIDDKSLVKLAKAKVVTLPVINRHLLNVPKDRAVLALRTGCATGLYTEDGEDPELACLETTGNIPTDAVVKMCQDRQPYVDQCQCLPIFIGPGRSAVELARHLRRANSIGFGIGIYKCLLSPRANYR